MEPEAVLHLLCWTPGKICLEMLPLFEPEAVLHVLCGKPVSMGQKMLLRKSQKLF